MLGSETKGQGIQIKKLAHDLKKIDELNQNIDEVKEHCEVTHQQIDYKNDLIETLVKHARVEMEAQGKKHTKEML